MMSQSQPDRAGRGGDQTLPPIPGREGGSIDLPLTLRRRLENTSHLFFSCYV